MSDPIRNVGWTDILHRAHALAMESLGEEGQQAIADSDTDNYRETVSPHISIAGSTLILAACFLIMDDIKDEKVAPFLQDMVAQLSEWLVNLKTDILEGPQSTRDMLESFQEFAVEQLGYDSEGMAPRRWENTDDVYIHDLMTIATLFDQKESNDLANMTPGGNA